MANELEQFGAKNMEEEGRFSEVKLEAGAKSVLENNQDQARIEKMVLNETKELDYGDFKNLVGKDCVLFSEDKIYDQLNKIVKNEEEMFDFLQEHQAYSLDEVAEKLVMTEDKYEKIWSYCQEKNVDPRFMLSVLVAEGTGSFNTARGEKTGLWRINTDFDDDLEVATNTIKNLISSSVDNPHRQLSFQAKCPGADPIEFIANGSCPGEEPFEGYCEGDQNWVRTVKSIYGTLGGDREREPLWEVQEGK